MPGAIRFSTSVGPAPSEGEPGTPRHPCTPLDFLKEGLAAYSEVPLEGAWARAPGELDSLSAYFYGSRDTEPHNSAKEQPGSGHTSEDVLSNSNNMSAAGVTATEKIEDSASHSTQGQTSLVAEDFGGGLVEERRTNSFRDYCGEGAIESVAAAVMPLAELSGTPRMIQQHQKLTVASLTSSCQLASQPTSSCTPDASGNVFQSPGIQNKVSSCSPICQSSSC